MLTDWNKTIPLQKINVCGTCAIVDTEVPPPFLGSAVHIPDGSCSHFFIPMQPSLPTRQEDL